MRWCLVGNHHHHHHLKRSFRWNSIESILPLNPLGSLHRHLRSGVTARRYLVLFLLSILSLFPCRPPATAVPEGYRAPAPCLVASLRGQLKPSRRSPSSIAGGLCLEERGGSRRAPEALQGHEGADRDGGRVSPSTRLQRNKHHRPIARWTALCWREQMWASDHITTTQNNILLQGNKKREREREEWEETSQFFSLINCLYERSRFQPNCIGCSLLSIAWRTASREEQTVSPRNMKATTTPGSRATPPSWSNWYLLGWTIIWYGTIQWNFLTEVGVVAVFLMGSLSFLLLLGGQGGWKPTFATSTIAFNETKWLGQTSRERKPPSLLNSSLLPPSQRRNKNNLKSQSVLFWFSENNSNSRSLVQLRKENDSNFEILHGSGLLLPMLYHLHPTDNLS